MSTVDLLKEELKWSENMSAICNSNNQPSYFWDGHASGLRHAISIIENTQND